MEEKQSLESQLLMLNRAILTLTSWLAQSHVLGVQDVREMEKLLGLNIVRKQPQSDN